MSKEFVTGDIEQELTDCKRSLQKYRICVGVALTLLLVVSMFAVSRCYQTSMLSVAENRYHSQTLQTNQDACYYGTITCKDDPETEFCLPGMDFMIEQNMSKASKHPTWRCTPTHNNNQVDRLTGTNFDNCKRVPVLVCEDDPIHASMSQQ